MSHGGCWPGMPVRRDETPGCRRDCLHRAMVQDYRDAKILADEARKLQREAAGATYPTERAEWEAQHPPLTFKQWLIDHRREDFPE